MLENAIKVVEAARKLRLVRSGNVTRSELTDPLQVASALEELREAVETFDRESSAGIKGLAYRPDYAMPDPDPDPDVVPVDNPSPEFVPEQGEGLLMKVAKEAVETAEQIVAPPPAPAPQPAPDFVPQRPARVYGVHDLLDGAVFDGDESVADLLLSIKSINDKLTFAVGKVGWNPRLRQLAEAARIANQNMYVEVDGPDGWVRLPAYKFASLTVAVAEAALDQDLSIALPEPKFDPRKDREYDNAPRPRP